MPKLHSMRDEGFPQITVYNDVPIPFTLWLKRAKCNIRAVVNLSDSKNPKWMTLPVKEGEPSVEVPVDEVLCWSPPNWL